MSKKPENRSGVRPTPTTAESCDVHPVALRKIETPNGIAFIVLRGTGNGVDIAIHIEPPAKPERD